MTPQQLETLFKHQEIIDAEVSDWELELTFRVGGPGSHKRSIVAIAMTDEGFRYDETELVAE